MIKNNKLLFIISLIMISCTSSAINVLDNRAISRSYKFASDVHINCRLTDIEDRHVIPHNKDKTLIFGELDIKNVSNDPIEFNFNNIKLYIKDLDMDSKGAEIASYFVYFLYVQEIPANNTITFDVYWKFDPMIENIEAYEIQLKYNDVVIR